MKVPTKFVTDLSPQERSQLIHHHQTSANFRLRNRSHAILLSHDGFALDEIARICRAGRDTVSGWLDAWLQEGEAGLLDEAKPGRPALLTAAEEETAVAIALQNPKFPARQLSVVKERTGKDLSPYTLKRLLKKKTIFGSASSEACGSPPLLTPKSLPAKIWRA
jgi:transposase